MHFPEECMLGLAIILQGVRAGTWLGCENCIAIQFLAFTTKDACQMPSKTPLVSMILRGSTRSQNAKFYRDIYVESVLEFE